MEKFKTVLKVIYFTLLSISILLGMVWGVLLDIPVSKPEWFDVLENIFLMSMTVLMPPLLVYGLAYSVREKRKIFKLYAIILSIFIITSAVLLLLLHIPFLNLQILEMPFEISACACLTMTIPLIIYAGIRHRRK